MDWLAVQNDRYCAEPDARCREAGVGLAQTGTMPWSVHLSPPRVLGPEYDPYRDTIARVESEHGEEGGTLVVYVREVLNFEGFRGFRPAWRPAEQLIGLDLPHEGYVEEVYPELDDLRANRIGTSTLRWLHGAERDAAWQSYLDVWGPHDASTLADRL